jgi:hypothetical protein
MRRQISEGMQTLSAEIDSKNEYWNEIELKGKGKTKAFLICGFFQSTLDEIADSVPVLTWYAVNFSLWKQVSSGWHETLPLIFKLRMGCSWYEPGRTMPHLVASLISLDRSP